MHAVRREHDQRQFGWRDSVGYSCDGGIAKCGVFKRAPACQVVVGHRLRHSGYWFVRQHQPQRHICNTPSGLAGQPAGMRCCVLRGSLRGDWQALNQPLKPQAHCITHQLVGLGIDNTHGCVLVAAV